MSISHNLNSGRESSPSKFTDCLTPEKKYAFFKQLTEDFGVKDRFIDDLQALGSEDLFEIAKWVAKDLNFYRFGYTAVAELNQFFEAYGEVCTDKLNDSQLDEIEILYAVAVGIDKFDRKEVWKGFARRLKLFLGDATQIKFIRTVEDARAVALALFGGAKSTYKYDETHKLVSQLRPSQNANIQEIKKSMVQLLKRQIVHFATKGFAERLALVTVDILDSAGRPYLECYRKKDGLPREALYFPVILKQNPLPPSIRDVKTTFVANFVALTIF